MSGVEDSCTFLPRGLSSADRSHRRRRPRESVSTVDHHHHDDNFDTSGRQSDPHSHSQYTSSSPPPPPPPPDDHQHHQDFPPSSITISSPSPYFHTQTRVQSRTHSHPHSHRIVTPTPTNITHHHLAEPSLPPPSEVIEAIRNYVSSYFQLGFLHKALFVERYTLSPESISPFLLLAICSIAAPFTPTLVARYGGKKKATDYFLERADERLGKEMVMPSLERAQAFLLLGVTEWGQGNGPKAWMLIGTAVRMAGFLGLHRESTYQLPPDPTPEMVTESEVARRTFWAITCHENLLAGQSRPMQISLTEIDVLLPCEESDFNFGIQPTHRASIAGTLGGRSVDGYGTGHDAPKSLFASLVQVKILWSLTARHACRGTGRYGDTPWTTASQTLLTALQDFEATLPIKHRFSVTNLRGMMVEGLDLAFLSITLITRLSNIVLRRLYLPSMAVAIDPDGAAEMNLHTRGFWLQMANEMVSNSEQLLSQVETFFGMRAVQLGFPPIMVFGVYMCGNVFLYLCKWPECKSATKQDSADEAVCPQRAGIALSSYQRCVEILEQLADSWPLASQWHCALQSSAPNIHSRSERARIRSAIREERTFDDELAGIYGQSAPSIIGTSPEDRDRQVFGDVGTSANRGNDQHQFPTSGPVPLGSHEGAGEIPDEGNLVHYLSIGGGQTNTFDTSQIVGENMGGGELSPNPNIFLDTFGDDLSAFLQGALPVNDGDMELDHLWDR
nr:uncharacterized protein CI109_001016 [Kwoniella shandongensis]KAA5530836.1 hypothetical protein CI109_001016 [Kwoniella shandongensis]